MMLLQYAPPQYSIPTIFQQFGCSSAHQSVSPLLLGASFTYSYLVIVCFTIFTIFPIFYIKTHNFLRLLLREFFETVFEIFRFVLTPFVDLLRFAHTFLVFRVESYFFFCIIFRVLARSCLETSCGRFLECFVRNLPVQ